jgi:hypothetical protein
MFTKVRIEIAHYEIEHTEIGNLPKKLRRKFRALHTRQKAVLQIREVYPGSRILIFIHPGSQISVTNFFKAKTLRIIVLFTQKFVIVPSKIWVWDRGSEIRDPEKTSYGSRLKKAPDPESGSATLTKSSNS